MLPREEFDDRDHRSVDDEKRSKRPDDQPDDPDECLERHARRVYRQRVDL
mgnify:CR=1 FL=1